MSLQHPELAAGRWASLSLVEQMAHIGCEVERALNWRARQNEEYCRLAYMRVLELIDLSLEQTSNYAQLKELARLREAAVDFFAGSNQFQLSEDSWQKYFLPFACAARSGRDKIF